MDCSASTVPVATPVDGTCSGCAGVPVDSGRGVSSVAGTVGAVDGSVDAVVGFVGVVADCVGLLVDWVGLDAGLVAEGFIT